MKINKDKPAHLLRYYSYYTNIVYIFMCVLSQSMCVHTMVPYICHISSNILAHHNSFIKLWCGFFHTTTF